MDGEQNPEQAQQPIATSAASRAWKWTPQRERAAELVAQGRLTEDDLAAEVGLKDRTTLWRWRRDATFAAKVEAIKAELLAAIRAEGLANQQNRLDGYQDRYDRLQRVIDERAADPSMAAIPGGTTGVLVREVKYVKVFEVTLDADGEETGPTTPMKQYREVEVYTVDAGTLKEMDSLAKQAAEDLGQWVTKGEVTGKGGEPLIKVYAGFDPEEV